MAENHGVSSQQQHTTVEPPDTGNERARWWLRNPTIGVLVAAVLGVATASVTASIRTPDATPGSTLLNFVILPIALLLPTVAIGGMFVAWRAFGAARGKLRLILAAPAAIGLILNAVAVAIFTRWLIRLVFH